MTRRKSCIRYLADGRLKRLVNILREQDDDFADRSEELLDILQAQSHVEDVSCERGPL
jgi:hypothetical protein